jgi:aspartyl-tRNA(Asn)/glutamyl-tRNA(Gln) amidotransferase subunit A
MTVDRWLEGARKDVTRRGLDEVVPLLESLATALTRLRDADWNGAADRPLAASTEPPAKRDDAEGRTHGQHEDAASVRNNAATAPAPRTEPELTVVGVASDDPARLPIRELSQLLRARTITAEALCGRCLAAIDERDARVNAFITVLRDRAIEQARAADARLARDPDGASPLCGVPISLKDLIDVAGVPTTAASRVRAGVVATADATVTSRLVAAGAVLVGKTNLHEFAFGTTNEDSAFGPVHHPLDPTRSPGGSSGGSAASVLAGMSVASIGTDTGGSIRIPAAACGLVGLKPTFGGIPTDGVVALGPTLDHVGPIARTVDDASILFDLLRGDPHVTGQPIGHDLSPRDVRLAIPRGYFFELIDETVRTAFEESVQALCDAGVTIEEVAIPHAALTAPVYLATGLSEAAHLHAATLESRPEDYTRPVRLRLEMSRFVLAEDYLRAQAGREVLRAEVDAALRGREALLLPSMPILAPRLGETTIVVGGKTESVRNLTLRLTQLFNLTGHPAISLPCGLGDAGLPVGAQLVGSTRRTRDLLRVAAVCERVWK